MVRDSGTLSGTPRPRWEPGDRSDRTQDRSAAGETTSPSDRRRMNSCRPAASPTPTPAAPTPPRSTGPPPPSAAASGFSHGQIVSHRSHQAFFQVGRIGAHADRLRTSCACLFFAQVALGTIHVPLVVPAGAGRHRRHVHGCQRERGHAGRCVRAERCNTALLKYERCRTRADARYARLKPLGSCR